MEQLSELLIPPIAGGDADRDLGEGAAETFCIGAFGALPCTTDDDTTEDNGGGDGFARGGQPSESSLKM